MRKELFEHEITILRDTFRRLLRRQANTNLIKLINKTHPADLAVVFRYFQDEEQKYIFSIMEINQQTTDFLISLDDILLKNLLNEESLERIKSLIQKAPTSDQSYILGNLSKKISESIFDLLKREEKAEIEELMAHPEGSAGSMMVTDVFTLDQNMTCGKALKTLQDKEEAEMVFYIYLTDDEKRLSLVGLIVRINDKVQRLINLVIKSNREAQNEPTLDAFKDLSVYGIIAQIVDNGKWGK
mgnify:CR=1 FL=1